MRNLQHIFTSFFWGESKPIYAFSIALVGAFLMTQLLYPLNFLLGQGDFFYTGDAAQHVSGWLFYAQDSWHFPLLYTERLNYPEGISIAFTDSIPFAALFFKVFAAYLPVNFNYIGWWHILVYTTQAISATFFIRVLGAKSLFSALIATSFALTWPTLTWRLGHASLMTHSLIIFSLSGYYLGRTRQVQSSSAFCLILSLVFIALLVHPYLFALCFAILVAFMGDQYFSGESVYLQLKRFCLALLVIFLTFFVFGYLGNAIISDGFDFFSMNLSAPFCGGRFIHCSFDATGGQYEGFQYFGLGFLLLLGVFLLLTLSSSSVPLSVTWHQFYSDKRALLLIFLGLFIFALSNKICLGNFVLLHYPIPDIFDRMANIFRSSGRFFWPISYAILFNVLAYFLRCRQLKYILLLTIALCIQWADTSLLRNNIIRITHKQGSLGNRSHQLSTVFSVASTIYMYPVSGCHAYDPHYYLDLQMASALAGNRINTGYLARQKTNCAGKETIFYREPEPNSLYISPINFISSTFIIPDIFSGSFNNSRCVRSFDLVFCGQHSTMNQLTNIAIPGSIEPWAPKSALLFNAPSLLR